MGLENIADGATQGGFRIDRKLGFNP